MPLQMLENPLLVLENITNITITKKYTQDYTEIHKLHSRGILQTYKLPTNNAHGVPHQLSEPVNAESTNVGDNCV